MAYLVLARKWRPETFADVVGQEHVALTLANAIRTDRVAHALPLRRPARRRQDRPIARILAKCAQLREGTDGGAVRRVRLLQGDRAPARASTCSRSTARPTAASTRSATSARPSGTLLSAGRTKVYIIDEVAHADEGGVQRAPEDARGAAASRRVRLRHDRAAARSRRPSARAASGSTSTASHLPRSRPASPK